ncbi:hypothetical protein [Rhizobium leguminosarum]|uniref:hypothetical protein n=1 Tax=Rhizobium leguminosarum TaxID=384 RepID=UPI0015FADA17|nr:hypothetical protein [Rhizobium leguminosarum]
MMDTVLQQAADNAIAMGPAVLVQGMQLGEPMDVVRAPALPIDDKRAILAAWASDFYAVVSKPALRQLPGTPEPVLIDDVQSALRELDRRYDL